MNNFADRISELRRERGLTQDAIAEQLGVTAQAVSKWERGESMPETAMLPKLAELFDVTIESLFGTEKRPIAEYVPENKGNFDSMVLRVLVNEGGNRVKVNLPMALIRTVMEIGITSGEIDIGGADLSKLDWGAIIKLVESGAVGRIVEVETESGGTVVIEVV